MYSYVRRYFSLRRSCAHPPCTWAREQLPPLGADRPMDTSRTNQPANQPTSQPRGNQCYLVDTRYDFVLGVDLHSTLPQNTWKGYMLIPKSVHLESKLYSYSTAACQGHVYSMNSLGASDQAEPNHHLNQLIMLCHLERTTESATSFTAR